MIVLGIDPGIANCGYAVIHVGPTLEHDNLVDCGVISTAKSAKKKNIFAADDRMRRAREVAEQLHYTLLGSADRFPLAAICIEALSIPRSASSAVLLAMCHGVVVQLAFARGVPVLQASPQEIKEHMTGSRAASKIQVQGAVSDRFGRQWLEELSKTRREHAADAIGAALTCMASPAMHLLRTVEFPDPPPVDWGEE